MSISVDTKIQKLYKNDKINKEEINKIILLLIYLVKTVPNIMSDKILHVISDDPLLKDIDVSKLLLVLRESPLLIDEIVSELNNMENDELCEVYERWQRSLENRNWSENLSTNRSVVNLMLGIASKVKPKSMLDICSGTGGVLVEGKGYGINHFKGYEINQDLAKFSIMRGKVHNLNLDIENCDVFNKNLSDKYDLVITDPPDKLLSPGVVVKDENGVLNYLDNERNIHGHWNFIYKAINSINQEGMAIAMAPTGALSNINDVKYREQIIDKGLLEKVIMLPGRISRSANSFFVLLVFSYNNNYVSFIDARKCQKTDKYGMVSVDSKEVMEILKNAEDKRAIIKSNEEIIRNKYNWFINFDAEYNSESFPDMQRLGDFAEIISGFQYTSKRYTESEPGKGMVSVVKIKDMKDFTINYDELNTLDISPDKIKGFLLFENDLLVSTKGTGNNLAIVKNLGERKVISQNNISIIRCNSSINPYYLLSFLVSNIGKEMFKALSTGAIIMNISRNAIEDFKIPVPDKQTQDEIAELFIKTNNEIIELKKSLSLKENYLRNIWEQ